MTLDDALYDRTLTEVLAMRDQAGVYIETLASCDRTMAVDFFIYFERAVIEAKDGTLDTHRNDDYTGSSSDFRHGLNSVYGKFGELKAIVLTAVANKGASTFRLCDTKEEQAAGKDFIHKMSHWTNEYSSSVKSTNLAVNELGFYFYLDWISDKLGNLMSSHANRLLIVGRNPHQGAWQMDFSLLLNIVLRKPDDRTFIRDAPNYMSADDLVRYSKTSWARNASGPGAKVCYHPPLPQVTFVSD